MKIRVSGSFLGNSGIVVVGIMSGAALWADDRATYWIDGGCLSYDRSEITYASDNPMARRTPPIFLVPSDIPTLSISDDAQATGLMISYSNWNSGPFPEKSFDGCGGTVVGDGLVRFPPRSIGDISVPDTCPRTPHHDLFFPEKMETLANDVRIRCAPDPVVVACSMTDRMTNGWEADISLPKTHIDQWRHASAAARAYFDDFLTDCGEPG